MTTRVATHNGRFHCNEVTAATILNKIYPSMTINRTRDGVAIMAADIVIDVGGIYDVKLNRFDHHQLECNEVFSEHHTIPMSSAGMVFKAHGIAYIMALCPSCTPELAVRVHMYIYDKFIQEIDALDNRIPPGVVTNSVYTINTNLSSIVPKFNGPDTDNEFAQQIRFNDAMKYVGSALEISVMSYYKYLRGAEADAHTIEAAFIERTNDEILVVRATCSCYIKCIHDYEQENDIVGIIKFVVYQSGSEWRVKTISDRQFVPRIYIASNIMEYVSLPEHVTFVHSRYFTALTVTERAAYEIAATSIMIHDVGHPFPELEQQSP
jgi:uncharacterized UPF0160 family protein